MTQTAAPLRISFPPQLPVSQRKRDIADAIRANQVVIVAGETGSGKTTQLPKICLELGRGAERMIGHTQPRRIAARTVAERIAEELDTDLGDVVGYQVRFTDRSGDRTRVKVMTDGILLAQIQRDRDLLAYDTIIIDEAHERSLNIDFLLGYLKRLLPRRSDLKLVITSATIDPERFSRHFDDAPILEVSGRMYPVELRYREIVEDQTQAITDAVGELTSEGPGDILVFLSGEREIRDASDALAKVTPRRVSDAFEVLPLYARLSSAEQHRVFAPHPQRRVVLATNVAETSLTVPGVRYVVDTGLARISRYSTRTKVQRLPIEPISQASANQRAGRCGRVADGICIRLYAEEDFAGRPPYTEPEILRTNLASVILQMTALDLGDIAAFPFVEPPDIRRVRAGVQLLDELGALTTAPPRRRRTGGRQVDRRDRRRLTEIGRQLVQLPIDPRLGRMVIEAGRNGCVRDVVTIVAALSIQDPRERPSDEQQLADAKHRRFADPASDFAGLLNLWRHLKQQQDELSSSAFRRRCRADYLNYLRIREWQDLDAQIRGVCKQIGVRVDKGPSAAEAIHRSLLAGLLSHIGMRDPDRRDYLGARGTRFAIFPGSALFKKPPEFVMAAELVETGRLWARINATVEPGWAESLAAHLVKRTYSEPHWEKKRGAVMALERVTLYGVPIVVDRSVNFGRIDKATARELFIRHALVQGEWRTHHRFFAENQRLLEEAEELEQRARRRGIVADDETIFDFYDSRVGPDVVSVAHFDAWWKTQERATPDLFRFPPDLVVPDSAEVVSGADFPDVWRHGEHDLTLDYTFDPGQVADGVTVEIPVAGLNQVGEGDFSWPVPGLRQDLVVALLRSLPKSLRVNFVPAPDHARAFLAAVTPGEEPLLDALERHLRRSTGVVVTRGDWDLDKVPNHLRFSFRVVAGDGDTLAEGKDLDELKQRLRTAVDEEVTAAGSSLECWGISTWDFGDLPRTFSQTRAGHQVVGFPALADEGTTVAIRVFATQAQQDASMRLGVRRLLMLAEPPRTAAVVDRLDNAARLALTLNPYANVAALLDDCYAAAVDVVVETTGGPPWDAAGFVALRRRVAAEVPVVFDDVVNLVRAALLSAYDVDRQLSGRVDMVLLQPLADLKAQWSGLVYPGFVADVGRDVAQHYPRYFAAMAERLALLRADPRRDAELMAAIAPVQAAYLARVGSTWQAPASDPRLVAIRWMLEELRVSLWAQHLRTPRPVSVQRIERALSALDTT